TCRARRRTTVLRTCARRGGPWRPVAASAEASRLRRRADQPVKAGWVVTGAGGSGPVPIFPTLCGPGESKGLDRLPTPNSVNHMLPSGPAVMAVGPAWGVGSGASAKCAVGVIGLIALSPWIATETPADRH